MNTNKLLRHTEANNMTTITSRRGPIVLFVTTVAALSLAVSTASAQDPAVPEVLPYQGFLTDGVGNPVSGSVDLTFNLYDAEDAVTPVWTESMTSEAVNGAFYVYLGMSSPVADHFNDGSTMWLGIAVGTDAEATPRQMIGSVPYALLSRNALQLGGIPANQYITREEVLNLLNNVASEPYVLGVTTNSANGVWSYNGEYGITAAYNACQDDFGAVASTAHMCTAEEVVRAVQSGNYDAGAVNLAPAWVMSSGFGNYTELSDNGTAAGILRQNCQNLLYSSGDVAKGTTAVIDTAYTAIGGTPAPGTHTTAVIADNVGCGGARPVLCCR